MNRAQREELDLVCGVLVHLANEGLNRVFEDVWTGRVFLQKNAFELSTGMHHLLRKASNNESVVFSLAGDYIHLAPNGTFYVWSDNKKALVKKWAEALLVSEKIEVFVEALTFGLFSCPDVGMRNLVTVDKLCFSGQDYIGSVCERGRVFNPEEVRTRAISDFIEARERFPENTQCEEAL